MAKFLVGNGMNMWNFENAIAQASAGDIIEFQRNFCPQVKSITINKDLTLIGGVEQNANGGQSFNNTIYGMIRVENNACVTLKDLWLQCDQERMNVVFCRSGAKVNLSNVVVKNDLAQGDVYPVLYVGGSAELNLDNVTVVENANASHRLYAENAKVTMNNCSFYDCRVVLEKSELSGNNVSINSVNSNVFNCKRSTLSLTFCDVNSAGNSDYPAIWGQKSNLLLKQCNVLQPQYASAICIKEGCSLESDNDNITSIDASESRVVATNTTIRECIKGLNKSYIYLAGNVHVLGENAEKVDIYVDQCSAVQGEKVSLYRLVDPNCRVNGSSLLALKEIELVGGNNSDIITEVDAESRLFVNNLSDNRSPVNTGYVQPKATVSPQLNARTQLEQLTGLKSVKKEIDKMLRMVEFNQQRIARGLEPQEQSYHAVFLGNPGTGKTTVARLIGEVLFESGAFKSDEFKLIEASEPDFISQNVGGTAQQTLALLEKAKGGVLFIDEAYALNKKGANVDFGIEAINTIMKYMEDHRDEIMIIFAGYTKEMEQFLKTNPGLKSRVPNTFVFEDYSPDEIAEIGVRELVQKDYSFEDEEFYVQNVKRAYRNSLDHSNARWIRNFNEKLVKCLADRVMDEGVEDFQTIIKRDIDDVMAQSKYKNLGEVNENAIERLQKLIGINQVKEQVDQFVSLVELNQKREEQGMENGDFTLHSLFLGNPGTGKTTVARIVGEILYQKGIIAEKKFIEVSQSDLIAGFVGQTAIKTKEVLESALGGVLFIDEAYSLTQSDHNSFGDEAVNEILKFMEDHRKDIVIILAGYTKEMGEFMNTNSGLVSRVPHRFDFEDYTPDELVQIGLLNLYNNDYKLDESAYGQVVKECYRNSNDRSNGRWVRNLNEKLIMILSRRISKNPDADITLIVEDDLVALAESYNVSVQPGQSLDAPRIDENGYVLPN